MYVGGFNLRINHLYSDPTCIVIGLLNPVFAVNRFVSSRRLPRF